MNDHPDLVALLRGELPHADVTEVGDHLDCCDEYRHELAETAVGRALLTGTTRTLRRPARLELPEVPPLKPPTSSPPPGLAAPAWPGRGGGRARRGHGRGLPVGRRVPRVAPHRGGSRADRRPGAGRGHRVGTRGDGRGLPRRGADERRDPRPAEDRRGPVLRGVVVQPEDPEDAGARGSRSRRQGLLLEVPGSLMGRYRVVDISLERDDGEPGHSATSVLRAKYT